MRRRDLLPALGPAGLAFAQSAAPASPPKEWVTSTASRDTAPRVGLIPSTFTGGEEMDGRKIRGLARPAPLGAPLSAAQLEDMVRLAADLGGGRRGGLPTAIGRQDWVVIKTSIQGCPGKDGGGAWHPAAVTDPRLVAAVLRYLAEQGLGQRFTVVEGAPFRLAAGSVWDSTWEGEFDGLSYRAMADAIHRRYGPRVELVDLNTAPSLEMPVEGRAFAARNQRQVYHLPRLLRECDKVISLAPLATMAGAGVALSLLNYLGFAPGQHYGYPKQRLLDLGTPGELALDLFSFHPADYAIVGGSFAAEKGGTKARRHNVVIAGTSALAVDAAGAAVMGLDSTTIRHLGLAVQRGYGSHDASSLWTRGSEIEAVKTVFQE